MHCAQRSGAAHQGQWHQHFLDSLAHFTFAKSEQFIPWKWRKLFVLDKSIPLSIVLRIFLQSQWDDPWKEPHLVFLNINIPLVT